MLAESIRKTLTTLHLPIKKPTMPKNGGDSAFFLPSARSMPLCEHAEDDDDVVLKGFRTFLRWMCLDQSDPLRAAASWSVFLLLAAVVPALSHFALVYNPDRGPYDLVAQLSLSATAALSFLTLSALTRRHGLRRFLFLHNLHAGADRVRLAYAAQLRRSTRLLACFVAPLFAAEASYKIAWYGAGAGRVPFAGSEAVGGAVACVLELASWVYRTANFFMVCVLFRQICNLHILRLQDFAAVFEEESDAEVVLREHLRVRRQLKVISHRFRGFILLGMVLVTVSQFSATLVALRPQSDDNFFNTGELALCSIVLVTGLFICLRSAAKITHKAQALTSHAAKWHVCATIQSAAMATAEAIEETTPSVVVVSVNNQVHDLESDEEEEGSIEEEDELEATKVLHPHAHTISFQKRQALVTYLENNRAGITIFGFTLDRAWLHTIFMLEVVIFLWLLGKTIGIS